MPAETIQAWTRTTLAKHIVGSLNTEISAAGGTVPARLVNIVNRAYYDVWDAHDFMFRKKSATLTIVVDTAVADLPSDYAKLDMKWLKENNARGALQFTQDTQWFESQRDLQTNSPGTPWLALLETKTSETTKHVWQVRVLPLPEAGFTYPYIYLRSAPVLELTNIVLWPRPFYRGWELLATWRAEKAFRDDKAWKDTKDDYGQWLADAISDKDEAMRSDVALINDTDGDFAALGSQNAF